MKPHQKTRYTRCRKGERGSILIICMVLAGLGTLGAAAFFSLMDAKMMESEQMNAATERRAKQANSLALAKEVVQRKYLAADTGPAAAETHTLPGGWGECTIAPFSGTPMGSTAATRTHKTGAVSHKAFSYDIDVEIGDGDIKHARQFQIKSYNPILGGDLLYMGQPTIDNGAANILGGNVNVKGRARFWTGGDKHKVTIKADQYVGVDPKNPNLALNDTSDRPDIAQNFPFPGMTAGRYGGAATPAFDGTASVIANPDNPWNSYADTIANSGDYQGVDGDVFVGGSAVQTHPPTPSDPVLITALSLPPDQIKNAWAPFLPVSSNVLAAAWGSGLPGDTLKSLLLDNTFLPQDVLQLVINDKVIMSAIDRQEVLDANAVGAFSSNGAGEVTLDLDAAGEKHIVATNVESLTIFGQADATAFNDAENLDPLIVLVHNDAASTRILQKIEFKDPNNRRLILAVKQENSNSTVSLVCTGSVFPEWRMVANLENVPAQVDLSGVSSATMVGGIWTDRSFEVSNGALTIERETDPGGLEWMGARVAWLEVYRK